VEAEKLKIKSIAIPALGIASSKFPYDLMAKITIQSVFQYFLNTPKTSVKLIVISMFNKEAYGYFVEQFKIVAAVNALIVEDFH
jgi:O-acetyl-ADP-ribose deacetylase (regulator of RNase III)